MTKKEIIENKSRIFLCAKAFRNDANILMQRLAEKFNFDIKDCGAWPAAMHDTNHNNKKALCDEWMFYLHGAHCCFNNIITGQVVEVRYTEKPEFGFLDGFFFYRYMETNNEFKSLAEWFGNYSNVFDAIDVLVEEGTLIKQPGTISGNYIIAL